jgi:adenylate cyclase
MSIKRILRISASTFVLAVLCMLVAETFVYVSGTLKRSPLEGLENQIVDLSFQVRAKNPAHKKYTTEDIVIIDIDDESIERLGRPALWPRAYDAIAISYVSSGNPRAIGMDYLYTESDSLSQDYALMLEAKGFENAQEIVDAFSTDNNLADAIWASEKVYLSMFDDDMKTEEMPDTTKFKELRTFRLDTALFADMNKLTYPVLPIPQFTEGAKAVGTLMMPTTNDGTVRYYALMHKLPHDSVLNRTVANFPLYMLLADRGIEPESIKAVRGGLQIDDTTFFPLLSDASFRINWLGSEEEFRRIPYYKVITQRTPAEFFENKFVLFGTSASGMQDLKTVPSTTQKIPGVEVHAVALLNMLNGEFINEVSERSALPYFLLASVLLVLLFLALRPLLGFAVSLVLIFGEMALFVLWFLPKYQSVFPIVTLMLITFFAYIFSSLYIYFIRERKSRRLKYAFGSYVSPEVVEQISRDSSKLHLGGEKKELSVLFSDIRGFTTYSEKLDPEQIVAVLNNYLSRMSDIIFKHKGTIDKFIGDAVMCIFGAPIEQPDHAVRSCRVALDMIEALERFNVEENAPLAIGIGINTGPMTVGNIGSQRRFDYTVIGDSVNLASRLESLTKRFGVSIIVSESTQKECSSDEFIFRELGFVQVKGKDSAVRIFQLVDWATNGAPYQEWIALWTKGLHAFYEADFDTAIECFEQSHELFPADKCSELYINLCNDYKANPEKISKVLKMEEK